jgi:hypothetical protein
MSVDFRPRELELRPLPRRESSLLHDRIHGQRQRYRGAKNLLWLLLGLGLIYAASKASAALLLTVAGITLGVVAILLVVATAVCIYAENNTCIW